MKKNLLTILVLAFVIANLILTVILTFSIIPEVKKTDALVSKISNAIDLELKSTDDEGNGEVPIEDIVVYNIEDSMTINLKTGEDGSEHFAIVSVSLSMDSTNSDYSTYSESLSDKESLIKNEIINVISSYTMDQLNDDTTQAQEEILSGLQTMFNSDFIVQVVFSEITYQ